MKIGIGQQRLIGGKANKNGVLVNAFYYGGLSIGLLKPYYVNVLDPADGVTVKTIKYGESIEYNQAFLDRDNRRRRIWERLGRSVCSTRCTCQDRAPF